MQHKIRKYIKIFAALFVLSIGISSCLKDSNFASLTNKGTDDIIMFQDNGGPDGTGVTGNNDPFPLYNYSFSVVNDTAGFDVLVYYGPVNTAPEDITLHLAVNKAALDSFNNVNGLTEADGDNYVMPDSSIYSFPSTVTIKKGTHLAIAHVTITQSASFNFAVSYALPISITSASSGTVSSNFGTEIDAFAIRNKYDGDYDYTMTGWNADPVTAKVQLQTYGQYKVLLYDASTGGSLFTIYNNKMYYSIDPTTNVVTAGPIDYDGEFAITQYPSVSKYNPDDGSIHVEYDVLGAHIVEDFKYDGAR